MKNDNNENPALHKTTVSSSAVFKKLHELARTNNNDLIRFEEERDKLRGKMRFYTEHFLEEEKRITNVKLQAIDGIIYDYRQMVKDLKIILKEAES